MPLRCRPELALLFREQVLYYFAQADGMHTSLHSASVADGISQIRYLRDTPVHAKQGPDSILCDSALGQRGISEDAIHRYFYPFDPP